MRLPALLQPCVPVMVLSEKEVINVKKYTKPQAKKVGSSTVLRGNV